MLYFDLMSVKKYYKLNHFFYYIISARQLVKKNAW